MKRLIVNIICLKVLLMSFHLSLAQSVTIIGNEPDYVGQTITFYTLDNFIIESAVKTGECTVAASGDFSVSLPVGDVRMIFTNLGVFNVSFYVEPGFTYEVKLPPRIEKSPEDMENPLFEEAKVSMMLLSVKDDKGEVIAPHEELNNKIRGFYQVFNQYTDNLIIDAYFGRPFARLDSIIASFMKTLPQTGKKFFDNYAYYRSGMLYFAAQRNEVKRISDEYFVNKPVQRYNHAYMELFNATFDKYFMYAGRNNDDIFNVINIHGSFIRLKRLLERNGAFPNDTLCELVILKNIHDEFYADRFTRAALLNMLDSAVVYTQIERHSEIAVEIRNKLTRLLRGYTPPDFALYKHDTTLVSLQDYKNKYVYLMFCNTYSNTCISQYRILEDIYNIHHKWLDIVVVSTDENFSDMTDFRQKNGYLWDFLHLGAEPEVIKNYDVRLFPTAYLIDPEGKMAISPAPVPMSTYLPEDFDEGEASFLERKLWEELNSKGLWYEYLRRELINLKQ